MSFTISRRLAVLVATAILLCVAAIVVELYAIRDSIVRERRVAIAGQVEAALSVVKSIAAEADAGRVSKEDAQSRAKAAMRAIRFGNNDYFYVYDYDGVNLAHGVNPKLEGQNLMDQRDANGVRYMFEVVQAAKQGGGYVNFLFPRPGQPERAGHEPRRRQPRPAEITDPHPGAGDIQLADHPGRHRPQPSIQHEQRRTRNRQADRYLRLP